MKHNIIALALATCLAFVASPASAIELPIGNATQTAPAIAPVAAVAAVAAIPDKPEVRGYSNPSYHQPLASVGKCFFGNGWKMHNVDDRCVAIPLTGDNGGGFTISAFVAGSPGNPGSPGSPGVPAQCTRTFVGVAMPGHNGVHQHNGNC